MPNFFGCPVSTLAHGQESGWLGRASSWEVYGKVQEAVARDPEFAQLQAERMKIAELQGRNIAVGIDL